MRLIATSFNVALLGLICFSFATKGFPDGDGIYLVLTVIAAPVASLVALWSQSAALPQKSWLSMFIERKRLEEAQKLAAVRATSKDANKVYLPRMSPSQFASIASRQINAGRFSRQNHRTMLPDYKRKAQVSAGVFAASIALLFVLLQFSTGRPDISEPRDLPRILVNLVGACAYWYGFWTYAKAKGYSGWIGVLLGWFLLVGLLVLALLRDRTRAPQRKSPGQV